MEHLKYVHAVLNETLRLYPSGGFVSRVTNTDVDIGPYSVPADTTVLIPLALLQTLPEHFPEPEAFRPDRFMVEVSFLLATRAEQKG